MNTKNPYIFINSFILFQYPKGLGNTVEEVKISNAVGVFPKTKFSMLVPDVEAAMSDLCRGEIKHVILCGIEVFIFYIFIYPAMSFGCISGFFPGDKFRSCHYHLLCLILFGKLFCCKLKWPHGL